MIDMRSFFWGLSQSFRPPRRGDPERPYWLLKVPYYVLSFIWWRGFVSPVRERYWRLMFWLHRGDAESKYWAPAKHEVVTTCAGKRGVTVSLRLRDREAIVDVEYPEGIRREPCSFTSCLEPGWSPDVVSLVASGSEEE